MCRIVGSRFGSHCEAELTIDFGGLEPDVRPYSSALEMIPAIFSHTDFKLDWKPMAMSKAAIIGSQDVTSFFAQTEHQHALHKIF